MKTHYTIIDGYNVIGQSEELKEVAKESLEEARKTLLLWLVNYNARQQTKLMCVFDAYNTNGVESKEYFHGIHVIYSKRDETADAVIERLVYDLYDKHITRITVVTSDLSEQHTIFGSGALRISSREFLLELQEEKVLLERELLDINEDKPRIRISIDEETKERLEALRRGYK
ncbi:NYN domain-containing protein [Macrococcus brunensis]|uniref:NYN domain-containing protein n=1 Tax=Macrococcus brunensis TaxID=198483 RepID=A0A4V3BDE3_9STAP|nr:NYN domain-containing protein [Macrococcus brunensis]TDL97916.1 NYN domain-containing protein [Macrococcus brunensis]ULG71831.1 NYN domain-containing protein [Macrococcus brunensis]ULG74086.1 NYN domain-containing protein [Macrococcus brunensis]